MRPTTVTILTLVLLSVACQSLAELRRPNLLSEPPAPSRTTDSMAPTTLFRLFDNTDNSVVLIVGAEKYLNLRDRPDASGPIPSAVIGRMPYGAQVTWLNECQDGWAKIRWKNKTGWAKVAMLEPAICKE